MRFAVPSAILLRPPRLPIPSLHSEVRNMLRTYNRGFNELGPARSASFWRAQRL